MGTPTDATHKETWKLNQLDATETFRTVEDIARDAEGNPILIASPDAAGEKIEKKVIRYEKRKHYVLNISRKLIGLTAIGDSTGAMISSFSVQIGAPSTTLTYTDTGKKWRCTRDHLVEDKLVVGGFLQEQQWEYYSPWEEADLDEFVDGGS